SAKILPTPKSVVMSEGRFTIPAQADVAKIAKATVDKTLAAEAYTLSITPKAITITGGSDTGVFWATQSLLQLVETDKAGKRTIACQTITDEPTYRWRSFMLDSGRQYQTIAHLKKTLDWMARYKLNIFHWHLTESDGWRIEIKSQPKLTEIGSKVSTGKEQQGFYTQAEIREVVAYAKARHITIVPEIDLPGHAFALMASYPEFSCKGTVDPKATDKKTRMNPIVCAGKAEADNYKFLASILNEVCDLFPNSPYIHTGGDEAPKAHWDQCPSCQALLKKHNLKNMHELQIHFTNRIAAILKARGRKAICWDDVIAKNGGPKLADNVVVNWWNYRARKDRMVFKALEMGREVILNPNNYTYLNFPISPYSVYGKGRTFGMAKCYTENPAAIGMSDKITDEQRKLILGMGASLWTDGNLMQAFLDIRTFPRIFAMSELMWHGKPAASLEDMQKLADAQKPWLKANGYVSGRAEESDGPTILPEGYTEKLKPAKKTVPRKTRKKKAAK
ncbi:MAG: beta-N-acetylhexosaminidase, partial [Phycisphaerales bacterium]|nr:beta-N-acetylhexosaminidase [Phycisphaerales bacterium]